MTQGLYSLSCKSSYRKISWSLEAARFGFKLFQSLPVALPRCLSNFRAILPLQHPISRLRDFTRFCGKTSYRLVNRGPDSSHDLTKRSVCLDIRASIHWAVRRLTAKIRTVSKPREWVLWLLYRSKIWQASRQRCCWGACQISERFGKFKPDSRGLETSWYLVVRHPSALWIEFQDPVF